MKDLTKIPKSIIDIAKETTSKPVKYFSEFIALKLFGKPIARLRAEMENEYDKTKQQGEIERKVRQPFIVQIEMAKVCRQYSNLGDMLIKAKPLITATKNNITDDNDVFWDFLNIQKKFLIPFKG